MAGSEAVNLAVKSPLSSSLRLSQAPQPPDGLVNTYTEPDWEASSSSPRAPITMKSPSTATADPNASSPAPSGAVSLAVSVSVAQFPAGLTNT